MTLRKRKKKARKSAAKYSVAAIIRRVFRSAKSYHILDTLGSGGTWQAGGCWIAAEAIKRVFGGVLYSIESPAVAGIPDTPRIVQHVFVLLEGFCIDSDGKPAARKAFLTRYVRLEMLDPSATIMVFSSAARAGSLIPHSQKAIKATERLLREALP